MAGGRMTTETRLNKALKVDLHEHTCAHDYELMSKEKDVVLKEKDVALKEKDVALKEKDVALKEKDVACNERDEALKERDKALKENARLGTQLRELQEVVEQERRTAVGREAEVKKLSEGREQLKAQMEGYCQCMEEQKKTLALANENITLLKSQLQSHEEIRRHDQIERDKSEVIIKDLGRRCEALQSVSVPPTPPPLPPHFPPPPPPPPYHLSFPPSHYPTTPSSPMDALGHRD